jgi:glycosyltransferase involved in cell wall biosynthesis
MKVAIIIPAYNEEITIAKTIVDFYNVCPDAHLCVVNNCSTDRTPEIACEIFSRLSGGGGGNFILINELQKGKSNAIRAAFRKIEADVYVMVDADDTYSAADLSALLEVFHENNADMVVGDRHSGGDYERENSRVMHGLGNNLVRILINYLFHAKLHDILSGYRVFSRRFVKSFPILSKGFELEVEMTIHGLNSNLTLLEHPVSYKERPEFSASKLNTFSDGFFVLLKIFNIFRHNRPFLFFGIWAFVFTGAGLIVGAAPVIEFIETGKVLHFPSAILAVGLVLCGLMSFSCAVILDTFADMSRRLNETNLIALSKK